MNKKRCDQTILVYIYHQDRWRVVRCGCAGTDGECFNTTADRDVPMALTPVLR